MNEEKLKKRWAREDEQRINSAVSKFIEDAEGRKFLWWLLEIGRIGTQPFSNNALQTAFGCGELNVGQRILDRIISVSPDGYLRMMQENNSEYEERNKLLGGPADDVGADDGEVNERA